MTIWNTNIPRFSFICCMLINLAEIYSANFHPILGFTTKFFDQWYYFLPNTHLCITTKLMCGTQTCGTANTTSSIMTLDWINLISSEEVTVFLEKKDNVNIIPFDNVNIIPFDEPNLPYQILYCIILCKHANFF